MISPILSSENHSLFILDAQQNIVFISTFDENQNKSISSALGLYVTSIIPNFPVTERFIPNSLSYLTIEFEGNRLHLYVLFSSKFYYCYVTRERLLISADVNDNEEESTYNIIDHSFDGITINDSNGQLLFGNQAYGKMCGIDIKEFTGLNCHDFVEMNIIDKSVASEVIKTKKRAFNISTFPKTNKVALIISTPIFNKQGEFIRVVSNIRESRELSLAKEELSFHSTKPTSVEKNEQTAERLVFESPQMQDIVYRSQQVADMNLNILITGETGSGKGVLAKYIYQTSNRRTFPFVKINCAALPESLIESELFGYESGAFTGALSSGKSGLLSAADKGILFLDEIGDLPYNMQAKLLDFLQYGEFTRIGSTKSIKVDVQVIAATNQNLKGLITMNKFRKDLYYRLNVISFHIPPLRERQDDIRQLTDYFMGIANNRFNKEIIIDDDVVNAFCKLPLYGNARELEHLIQGLFVLTNNDTITMDDLKKLIDLEEETKFDSSSGILMKATEYQDIDQTFRDVSSCSEKQCNEHTSYKELVSNYELEVIKKNVLQYGSVKNAANALKVHPSLIWRKLQSQNASNSIDRK